MLSLFDFGLNLGLLDCQKFRNRRRFVEAFQYFRDCRKPKAHFLHGVDSACNGKLILAVITIAGEVVRAGRNEKTYLVIVPQHPDTDP